MSRLTKPYEFKEVFSSGKRFPCRYFTLYIKENRSHSNRIGLAVSKKTGTAVVRNRIKRVCREALRKLIDETSLTGEFQVKYDLVFVGKRECASVTMQEVYEELKRAVTRCEERKN
ncbi:MAG: ribonuclease P protein component [Thermodesulfovibrionales bacterium]